MASETPVAVEVEALFQQGDPKAALKLLERAGKEALAQEDVASLQEVLAGARLVRAQAEGKRQDEAGRIAYATQQNIRFLSRKQALAAGEEWDDALTPARPLDAGLGRGPSSMFGDPARPRSLALGLIASIASFPMIWFALVFFDVLSMGTPGASQTITQAEQHVFVGIAAGVASLGLIIATGGWVVSRRKVPVADRKPLAGPEGAVSAAGVIAAVAGAAVLGHVLWNLH